jgi:hypothetical protein
VLEAQSSVGQSLAGNTDLTASAVLAVSNALEQSASDDPEVRLRFGDIIKIWPKLVDEYRIKLRMMH